MPLLPLEPQRIGGLFGRPGTLTGWAFQWAQPKTRFIMIAVASALVVLALATRQRVLVSAHGIQPALTLLSGPPKEIGTIGMALAQDPAGLVVLLVTLLTPFFCSQQVVAIGQFVQMNEANLEPALSAAQGATVDTLVQTANQRFARVGRRDFSIVLALVAAAATVALYRLLETRGLMLSWNATSLPADEWRSRVFDGWWANERHHPALAAALVALGTYMLYFLVKQLLMGGIFAAFAHTAAKVPFGVTPNMRYNTDGYRGLRSLRRFMLWTYGSSLAHFASVLAVFVVWLPFSQWTFFAVIAIMALNVLVVVYPSGIAHNSALSAKIRFANYLVEQDNQAVAAGQPASRDEQVESVWSTSALPFRTRSTLTALTIYLLVPLLLAGVSALLKTG